MFLAEINEVIKASPAIQIQGRITHLQRRAWNVLLANAYHELPNKEIHTISVSELAAKLGFDSHNYEHLQESLRALRAFEVQWNILGKNNKEEWGVAGLLAEARIVEGICRYSFSPHLRMKLYNPIMYTKLNLRLQNRFKSQYALVLWEVCFDYFDTDRGQGETPFISIEKFRELMGLESDEYSAFAFLNRDVIKPAIKEINALTDYHVEVEQKRLGRKIAELKFRITRVEQIPIQESLFPDIENLPPIAIELIQADIDRKVAQNISDQAWNFVNPQKLPPPGTYPDFAAYVAEKIEISLHAAEVKNRSGFIIEAIRENYQTQKCKRCARCAPKKLEKRNLKTSPQNSRSNAITSFAKPSTPKPELVEKVRCGKNPSLHYPRTAPRTQIPL